MPKSYIVGDMHMRKKKGIVVVLEFESMHKARKFYECEVYQTLIAVRNKVSDTDLFLVEGV